MNLANKIFTNTAGQILVRALEIAVGVIALGLITRYLGTVGFGHYTTVTAILQLFIIVVDFGLYLTFLRELSARQERTEQFIMNNIVTLRLISSAAFLAAAIATVWFSPYALDVKLGVAALSVAYLANSLISTLTAIFQKHLHMVRIAVVNLTAKILLIGIVVVIIRYDLGLQALFYGSSIASLIGFLLVWNLLSRLPSPLRLSLRFDFAYWREILHKAWPLAATTALNLLYFKADTVILSFFHPAEAVGLYGAGYRVVEIITTFPHMFMGLVLPLLTAAWVAHDTKRLTVLWQKVFIFFSFLTLPMIAGTWVVGTQIMAAVAGAAFDTSGMILKILIIATAAIFFGTLYTYMALVIDRQRAVIPYFGATAFIALVGYLIAIPPYSYWGAAWMTVVSEVLIVIGAWAVVRSQVILPIPWQAVTRLGAAAALMGILARVLSPLLPLIPLVLVSAALYGALTILFRAVSVRDIKTLLTP